MIAFGAALLLASCGGSTTAEQNQTSDTANVNMANQSPPGDTANQINNRANAYPGDSSNKNGNDSVSGTSRTSRTSTPGNESGKGGRKE